MLVKILLLAFAGAVEDRRWLVRWPASTRQAMVRQVSVWAVRKPAPGLVMLRLGN